MEVFEERIKFAKFDSNNYSEDNFISLSLGKVYYEYRKENNGPLVVCMHGISWWSFIFQFLAEELVKNGYRVLLFDFYGRGLSASPRVQQNPKLLVTQTTELPDKLDLSNETFFLIGMSMGGLVASHFTASFPHRVKGLVLLGPAIVPIELPFMAKVMVSPYIGDTLFGMFGKSALLKRLKTERFRQDLANTDKRTELVENLISRVQWCIEEKEYFLESFHSTLRYMGLSGGCLDQIEIIQKHDIPVLILWGTEDQICPFNKHQLVLEKLPKAKLIPINNAYHACILDDPQKCHESIIQWFKELNEREVKS